jgi:hypothetical protein
MREKATNTPIIHSVYYLHMEALHVSALHCHLQGASHPQYSTDCFSIEHLSEGSMNAP